MVKPLINTFRAVGIKAYLNVVYPWNLKCRAGKVGSKDKIEVVFFAMNVAMWRYQGVYELLSQDDRFNCHIVFTVPNSFSDEQKAADLKQMRDYFGARGIRYVDFDLSQPDGTDIKRLIDPDILFYPQPYEEAFPVNHDFNGFTSKLLCYSLYGFTVLKGDFWIYDLKFHNLAWKIYCPTLIEKENAKRIARNHARNWVVSGYCNLDEYCSKDCVDVWKIKDRKVKRLIWAPHFTIFPEGTWLAGRSNFLMMCELMLRIADKYSDWLQIAFKPHPRLKSELYKHPGWGKEKTDQYYQRWAEGKNTQLETGDFVDLFKTSDAMIHDSGSFTAEYLYVNKPVAFVTTDFEKLLKEHNDFGQSALNQHYVVKNEEDILAFINDVVIEGKDVKVQSRTAFFNEVLKPNVKGSTSEFIVEDIKKSLGMA